ncbi:MAG TPA: hypothetical protein VJ206_00940 [bacterium]|nr:hypothetical protein [bacterium]
MKRLLMVVVMGGAVLTAVGLGWKGRSAPAPSTRPPAPRASVPRVSVGLQDASIVLRHQGVRQAEIHARRVTVSADLRSARFVGITRAIVFDQAGESLRVSAGEILLDRETNDFQIWGPVVITSSRGYHLTAPEAEWHHARQQVVFPRGVQVRHGRQKLQARRLVVDAGLTTFDLSGGVDIVFQLEGMPP